jgi:nucleotide-binding universal stress UspA family protein
MEDKLVTLAVHTNEKARILKDVLENEGIAVHIEGIEDDRPDKVAAGVRVRIKQVDLPEALKLVESYNLFDYADESTLKMDDGRYRILVPVDFSDYSFNACKVAFTIANLINAKVKILHMFYNPYYPSSLPMAKVFDYDDGEQYKDVLGKVRVNMQELCNTIDQKVSKGEFPSVNYSYSIKEGSEEDIVEYARRYKPVLIIMGTKGKDRNDEYVLGSVTAEIIEMSEFAVLAVPKNSSFKDGANANHIAFLTNFTQRDLISFDHLVRLVKHYQDAKITLIHVNIINKKKDKWSEEDIAKIRDYFTRQYPDMNIGYKLIDTEDMFGAIAHYLEDAKIDILALNTRKRNIFGRMFVPSVSRKLMAKSNTTLLVLRG